MQICDKIIPWLPPCINWLKSDNFESFINLMILWLKSVRTDCHAVDPLLSPVGSSYNQVKKSCIIICRAWDNHVTDMHFKLSKQHFLSQPCPKTTVNWNLIVSVLQRPTYFRVRWEDSRAYHILCCYEQNNAFCRAKHFFVQDCWWTFTIKLCSN